MHPDKGGDPEKVKKNLFLILNDFLLCYGDFIRFFFKPVRVFLCSSVKSENSSFVIFFPTVDKFFAETKSV